MAPPDVNESGFLVLPLKKEKVAYVDNEVAWWSARECRVVTKRSF